MAASGTALLDFGVFPGATDTTVAVTGQAAIVAGSLVGAWIRPEATAPYPVAVLADGADAYWRFGEASGNPQDSAGTNHVTVVGGTPDYGISGALAGDPDTAVKFVSASSEYFSVPDGADLDLGDGPFSIEFWVKLSTAGTVEHVLSKGTAAGNAYNVLVGSDGTLWLKDHDGGSPVIQTVATIADTTTWHHVVFTKNGAARAAYLDGAATTSLGTDVTLSDTTGPLIIAAYDAGTAHADLSLDEVALYKSVLTPAQVLAHYNARASAHSADEHRVEDLLVVADTIVAGTGFTIYGRTGNFPLYGAWTCAWAWS